jgi:hypothetical protein
VLGGLGIGDVRGSGMGEAGAVGEEEGKRERRRLPGIAGEILTIVAYFA